jgi:serine/threonine-protein kinase RsbW
MERSFPKQVSSLDDVFAYIGEFARAEHLDEDLTGLLNLAVEEIFVNLVKYNTESKNDVSVTLEVENNVLRISLVDRDVHPFDVTRDREVDINKPLHERKAGGLGLYLVKTIMDDVSYEYADRTSTIIMSKRLEA